MITITLFVSTIIILVLSSIVLYLIYRTVFNQSYHHKKKYVTLGYKFGLLFIIYILLRIFFFDIYRVSGTSMEPTLLDGDYVYVSKTSYGVRLPRSLYEIPWLNLLIYLYPFNLLSNEPTQHYKRLYSTQGVERGDIVIFNLPVYQKEFGIKRCTKVPTDTIAYLNNCQISVLPYHGYSINSKIDSLGIIERQICTHYCIKSYDSLFWFNHYYYFLEGDNKNESTDSRTWGAIQDDHIVGKALFIIFSKDVYNHFRKKRFFKQIE